MWPFKRGKKNSKQSRTGPRCTYCSSTNTTVIASGVNPGSGRMNVWRGQRMARCRCADCGRDFYAGEPPEGIPEEILSNDEDELREAEAEIKRQADEDGDHRYNPYL